MLPAPVAAGANVTVSPLTLLTVGAREVSALPYLLLLPAAIYTFVLFPTWHTADYGIEAWAVKHVYSWAHLFAIVDFLRGAPMGWAPTGAAASMTGAMSGSRYQVFRILQALFAFAPSLLWAGLALYRVLALHEFVFLPLCFAGLVAVYISASVALFRYQPGDAERYHGLTGDTTQPLFSPDTAPEVEGDIWRMRGSVSQPVRPPHVAATLLNWIKARI